jgi:hypothetical protein
MPRNRSGRKGSPRRDRVRTKPTLSEAPVRVALATSPQPDFNRALEHDLALAKAALLYADEVEMVGLGVSLLEKLRLEAGGEAGLFGILRSLDDEALAYVQGPDADKFPEGWREQFDRFMKADMERLSRTQPARAAQLRTMRQQMAGLSEGMRPYVDEILDASGSTELARAVEAKVIRIADLNMDLSTLFRQQDVRSAESDEQLQLWLDTLVARMADPRVRLLFDQDSAGLVQAMFDEGKLASNPSGVRLATQAALGAGLVSRLPAFPQARMDELLDMRKELASPLTLYRGAVVRYSRQLPTALGNTLDFEIQQLWESDVQPAIEILKDELADHGLVREMARSVNARDIRMFAWTSATSMAVGSVTDIGALVATAVTAASHGVPLLADTALDAIRTKQQADRDGQRREFYYLYEANRRLSTS